MQARSADALSPPYPRSEAMKVKLVCCRSGDFDERKTVPDRILNHGVVCPMADLGGRIFAKHLNIITDPFQAAEL